MKYTGKKEENKQDTKILNISYEQYCHLIAKAKQIVEENREEIIKKSSSEKLKFYEELKKRYNLNEDINENTEINNIFKNNILIPDTDDFRKNYDESGKNIRILAEMYNVSAPVIINRITEICTYENYITKMKQEKNIPSKPSKPILPKEEIQPNTSNLTTKIMHLIQQEFNEKEKNTKKIGEENEQLVHLNTLLRGKIEDLTEENKKLKEELKKANARIDYVKNFMNIAENTISSFEQEEHLKAA